MHLRRDVANEHRQQPEITMNPKILYDARNECCQHHYTTTEINCCNREEKSVIPEFAEDEVRLSVGLILVWSVSVDVGAEAAWLHCRLVVVVGNVHLQNWQAREQAEIAFLV